MAKKFDDIYHTLTASKNFKFLDRYVPSNQKGVFREAIERALPIVKERLYQLETRKEKETLENKVMLIRNVLEKDIFNVGTQQGSVRVLFQALGVKYHDNQLSYAKSNRHTVPLKLGNLPFPRSWRTMCPRVSSVKTI